MVRYVAPKEPPKSNIQTAIMKNQEICQIERRPGMNDHEFLEYLDLLERVLQRSIRRRIDDGTIWDRKKNLIVFKPGMSYHETLALNRIQFTISQITQ